MKRTERKHLKENELAETLAVVQDRLAPHARTLGMVAAAIVAILLVVAVVGVVRQRSAAAGEELLAEAMVALNAPVVPTGVEGAEGMPAAAQIGATGTFATEEAKLNAALPKLQAAADAYPDSAPGLQAQYHLAGALAALGRHQDAVAAFDVVLERAGEDSLYGRMARLGRADAQARAGEIDAAIESWKGMASADALPQDAILMELARAYVQKGSVAEARQTFTQLVEEHPDSPYTAEARAELEQLEG